MIGTLLSLLTCWCFLIVLNASISNVCKQSSKIQNSYDKLFNYVDEFVQNYMVENWGFGHQLRKPKPDEKSDIEFIFYIGIYCSWGSFCIEVSMYKLLNLGCGNMEIITRWWTNLFEVILGRGEVRGQWLVAVVCHRPFTLHHCRLFSPTDLTILGSLMAWCWESFALSQCYLDY